LLLLLESQNGVLPDEVCCTVLLTLLVNVTADPIAAVGLRWLIRGMWTRA
jgi:hypothetical protein